MADTVWAVDFWALDVWAEGFWAGGAAPPTPSPSPPTETPAGRSRRHQRYYVEIDGQQFLVASADEAAQLLQRARAIAERQAEEKSDRAVKRLKRKAVVPQVRVEAPEIRVSPELKAEVAPLIADIDRLYQRAAIDAELRLLLLKALREQQDADDDDDEIFLLM